MWTDSSAVMGICTRQGLGKLRHIDTQTLWVQEKVRTKQITLRKVLGDVNPADLLTKFLVGKEKLDQLIKLFGLVALKGRAKSAPLLKKKHVDDLDDQTTTGIDGDDGLEVCVLKDIDEDRDVVLHEACRHDVEGWPHLHTTEQIERLFPVAVPVPEVENIGIEERDEHALLHRRWAGVRLSVSRG